MSKVTIIGAGNVGATAAQIIASKNLADVVLIDVTEGLAQGKALDMMHMRSVEEFTVSITGSNNYDTMRNSNVVVLAAGIARRPGMTREDLLGVNAGIMKSVVAAAVKASPEAVFICVSNPLDAMTYLAFREAGLPSKRIMGMGGVLDSARLSFAVCEKLGARPASVQAWAVGAHGEGMVCWPRFTTVDGTPLTDLLDEVAVAEVVQRCVNGGAEVVAHLKTGSAYYAPGAALAKMVQAIVQDTREVMSVCAYLEGHYGIDNLYMNVPVRLGKNGVEEIIEFDLNDEELSAFQASAESVREGLSALPA